MQLVNRIRIIWRRRETTWRQLLSKVSMQNQWAHSHIKQSKHSVHSAPVCSRRMTTSSIIDKIINLGPQKVAEQELSILGNYPNTYTFSKAFAERALKKKRGNLPVTILRPSIITACYDDPFMGWIDSPAASGGITLGIEMGIMRLVHSAPDAIMDLIPCDYVSNNILVQTAVAGIRAKPILNVVHSATTTKNPATILTLRNYLMDYVKYYPWYSQ